MNLFNYFKVLRSQELNINIVVLLQTLLPLFGIELAPTAITAEKVWVTSTLNSDEGTTIYHDGSNLLGVSYKAGGTATEYLFYKNEIHSDEDGVILVDKIVKEKAKH